MSIKSILNSIFSSFEEERLQQFKPFDPVARQENEQREAERASFENRMENFQKEQEAREASFKEMRAERERLIAERHKEFIVQHHLSEIAQTHPSSAAHLSFLILLIEDHCSEMRLNASYSDDSSMRIGETDEATKLENQLIHDIEGFGQAWPNFFATERIEKAELLMTRNLSQIKNLKHSISKFGHSSTFSYSMDVSLVPQYATYQDLIKGTITTMEKEQLQSNFSTKEHKAHHQTL